MPFRKHTTAVTATLFLIVTASTALHAEAGDGRSSSENIVAGQEACDLGASLAAEPASDALAILFLERCHRKLPSREVREVMHEVRKRVRKSMVKRAPVSLALTPETARARLVTSKDSSDYSGHVLLNEDELWLSTGRYELEVLADGFEGGRFAIVVDSTDRILIPITLKAQAEAIDTNIDMSNERGAELGQVSSTADPREKKFKTLLADRYKRAPTPEPLPQLRSDQQPNSPWPYLAAGLGVASVGTGIALQLRDNTGPAIATYGAGAVLGGLATYLFLRASDESPQTLALGLIQGGAVVGISGSL
jgi:hypothetical protein